LSAAPTNEQLYQMILDLKKEISESKTRESNLQTHLNQAKTELESAKKQLAELPKEAQEKQLPLKEGLIVSAGGIYLTPLVDHRGTGNTASLNAEPGFQVSLGYQADDNIDYALKYKHFSANTMSHFNNINPFNPPIVAAEYKNHYDVLDFEIGKQFLLSEQMTLRVSGGIRYAGLSEHFNREYVDSVSYQMNNTKNSFWSIGPRITAAPTWHPFENNFRVFANIGASFLMGQQHEDNSGVYISSLPFGGSSSYKSSTRLDSFVTMIEAGSGIGYTIKADLTDIDLQAGYQFEHWLVSDQTEYILFRGFHGAYGSIGVKF
jgi:hypothetical protein